jgi:hypothetical protein
VSEDAAAPDIDVRRGNPTDDELAALVAVVGEAYREESGQGTPLVRARSRWELSARGLRRPLERDRGWGGFTG